MFSLCPPPHFWQGQHRQQRAAYHRIAMDVQIAVLCDAATDYNGKLNLLGTFDTIVTKQVPTHHPHCSVALRLVFSRMEEGDHQLRINFVDEDGRSIMPSIDLPLKVVFPPDASFLSRNFIVNIQHMKFPRLGQYAINIAFDGDHKTSIPLQVKQAPTSSPPPKAG